MMALTILILDTIKKGHGQLLVERLNQKDLHGSDKFVPFRELWDLEHWNSFYPKLPRFVRYDAILHDQYDDGKMLWRVKKEDQKDKYHNQDHSLVTEKPVHPYINGMRQSSLFSRYLYGYGKGKGTYTYNGHRHPAEILMFQGALRPTPYLQDIIQKELHALDGTAANETVDYMTLHSRVEPDMQIHDVCWDKKVLNLTQIFAFMEQTWSDPPAPRVFMPINRALMERESKNSKRSQTTTNWIAVENLKALNRARDEGLWGGRAKVFEFGPKMLKGTRFQHRSMITGAILDFEVAINAKIFIGTEVSSFSHDLVATRFFRGLMENYKFLPDGLHHWTPPGTEDPPGFCC
jgi:hypothetical protein